MSEDGSHVQVDLWLLAETTFDDNEDELAAVDEERKLYRRRMFKLGEFEFQIELVSAPLDQGEDMLCWAKKDA